MRPGYLLICIIAALSPFVTSSVRPLPVKDSFPGWPLEWEGRRLTQLPLSENEEQFEKRFPGYMGRFTDGEREIFLRWIKEPSYRLHKVEICYKGSGCSITPQPLYRDEQGRAWSCFRAKTEETIYIVRTCIIAADGQSYPDVSSWFWASSRNKSIGPWWAVTVAQREVMNDPASPAALNQAIEPRTGYGVRDASTMPRQVSDE